MKSVLWVLLATVFLVGAFFLFKYLNLPPVTASEPAWEMRCQRLAFTSDRTGTRQLYLHQLDTEVTEQLTETSEEKHYPAWSPNGAQLAFCQKVEGDWQIAILNLETGDIRNVAPTHTFNPMRPVWINNESIVYPSEETGNRELFAINTASGSKQNLTKSPGLDDHPHYIPITNQLLFTSERDGNKEIYMMEMFAYNVVRFTSNDHYDGWAVANADASRIFYLSRPEGKATLSAMNYLGGQPRVLHTFESGGYYPAVCNSGDKVLFVSDQDGDESIFAYQFESGEVHRLIDRPEERME
ncbi:MAG TPA: hypothetical protein DCE41_09115 [Cytophagales bacterium]|nr:hypothetical protein [Cytophagales bacterium]HAA20363.1 hypothetical protein [Cytophagales bacterium]HAP60863.1 hypothetical protein [Cytophagales bacterium]